MSIHKLTAGSGYDYLTRQVAALDSTEKGHTGLASYYTQSGETPGVWVGTGLAGIEGLAAGDVVTAEQMQALFGAGLHPLTAQRQRALQGPDLTTADFEVVARLGAPFKVYDHDISPFRLEVAQRIATLNQAAGLPGDWPVPAADRAKIRTEVATEFFQAEYNRSPSEPRELAATIAKLSRPQTTAVAGFDLTFSPVKSVSTLWAIAPTGVAAAIEQAHRAAVQDALTFIEQQALFTRTGTNGIRQVNVQGLVATAFTHRDSRAGDPDLHTHVAVANKVQTLDGRWLSIDGRVLFKATVAASETYNTALELHLNRRLGLRFGERPNPDRTKRPVREVVGVDPALNERWSTRRAHTDARRGELAAAFQRDHGRPPTPVEALQLAQRATLETRDAKHEPRSLMEQRTAWRAEAAQVLGGPERVDAMVREALDRGHVGDIVDAAWVGRTADRILASLEERRSTWQVWHVRAEAQRRICTVKLPHDRAEKLVDLLVAEVLDSRSISLAKPSDGVEEPPVLRRVDGASVYTVAGSDLYTSTTILAAEQRLVATAGRTDGHFTSNRVVDVALLQATANGVTLDAGQAGLVREMATSGRRLQLAIAPAGAGKTTALQALTAAWTDAGGTVVGLAPSAAAAAQLRDHTGTFTDTLAKLTWGIHHDDLPDWATGIGPKTLVLVDEAGMADTLSLDTAVQFVVGRGGSVRLVGDDQQLAAIGAGGILRDIASTHGAVRLTELHRFVDPAEAAVTLAVRDGRPEALGFYLDHHRVHVGDLTTATDDLFSAWHADRRHRVDAIMLAPTRDLVAQLNHRARAQRITEQPAAATGKTGPDTVLADGNDASAGDLVITRSNDRRLAVTSTDWVKNGDRWTIQTVHGNGDLTVSHVRHHRIVRLPAGYVQNSVELGYATTIHGAQGVSADTMHGLVTGEESRQQLYTMLTRGRTANHVYLQVVGDGDPHSVIHPNLIHPLTATDLLEQILARDDTPQSATTLQRDLDDPSVRLGDAAARYVDALHVAAEMVVGPETVARLDAEADRIVPGLTDEPAWPTLRAHLLLVAADGADPVSQLGSAARHRELDTADDRAAVLDWRLDTISPHTRPGPLPWLPATPQQLRTHAQWGPYLHTRAQLVTALADQIRDQAAHQPLPEWARQAGMAAPIQAIGEVAVWRATMQIPADDQRPTGPVQWQNTARRWQQHLDRLVGDQTPATQEWGSLLSQLAPTSRRDPFTPVLVRRLAAIARAGIDAHHLLHQAAEQRALPDDHAAGALWWRIQRRLAPTVATQISSDHPIATVWTPHLPDLIGPDNAHTLQTSPSWPALVTVVDHALQRGWRLDDLLGDNFPAAIAGVDDACQGLVWRIVLRTDPIPDDLHEPFYDQPPADLWDGINGAAPRAVPRTAPKPDLSTTPPQAAASASRPELDVLNEDRWVEADLAAAALIRQHRVPLPMSDAAVGRMHDRAMAWRDSPVARDRMLQINQLTADYYRACFAGSWSQAYLTERMHVDLTDDARFRPGHAPDGWTHLVRHLHRHGITDQERTAAGVATVASTGRVIDRFRNRLVFPIIGDHQEILGFVGRRHPDLTDADHAGPKYLNTADTPLFHKSAQLFGAHLVAAGTGRTPVLVEGPVDAIAVTLAGHGRYIGVALLGTALTEDQTIQLARLGADPIIATDNDAAGRAAAEHHFWALTRHGLDPHAANLPDGSDPADHYTRHWPQGLVDALRHARPLGQRLLDERLTQLPGGSALPNAARIVAAMNPTSWDEATRTISSRLNVPLGQVRDELHTQIAMSRHEAGNAAGSSAVSTRTPPNPTVELTPEQRWAQLAGELDPRLTLQDDWPATARLLQLAHDNGHNIALAVKALVADKPLNDRPAQDLRYRIAGHINLPPQNPVVSDRTDRAAAGPSRLTSFSPQTEAEKYRASHPATSPEAFGPSR